MTRCVLLVLLGVSLAWGGAASAQDGAYTPAPKAPQMGGMQFAQTCGWCAIYACTQGHREASGIAARYRGYVSNTSSDEFPNFRAGWYCVVEGPTSQGQATDWASDGRRSGYGTAYAKNSC
jgi:hypothetical protein